MRIGVYFCLCGPNIAEKIDSEAVRQAVERLPGFGYYRTVEFLCSAVGTSAMEKDVRENRPDRVVVAACSVRDHEETFRGVLARAGMNPFLMQMVNVREHIAWVTADREKATEKAIRHLGAAMRRVALHEPLERREIDVCTDVLVVGAGPAGLKAALNFAEAGRKVCLVEKEPVLGGLPARYEAMFPDMECGPCVLETVLGDVLHGPHAERIEILTLSSVADVVGYYGNYTVTIRQSPRYISPDLCIACGECIPVCPAVSGNPFNYGINGRKAVDYAFQGGLPNLPFIDPESCLRTTGNEDCRLCREACPVEGAVVYEDSGKQVTRQVGAILVATGAGLYDCSRLPNLGYGRLPDVFTSLEFERILAANGPTGGAIRKTDGSPPKRIAILHCVGSLDPRHKEYCSGVCCETAFKFNRLVAHKLPGAEVTHFYKTFSVPGKRGYKLFGEAGARASTRFVRYDDIDRLEIRSDGSRGHHVVLTSPGGGSSVTESDMVVLCPALVPSEGTARMAQMLEAATDRFGFMEELHGRMDSVRSKVRGIYMAGTCQAPMDTQKAVEQALAASGAILAGLVPGRKLVIEPVTALVDAERCSACRSCIPVCPYKAISFDSEKDSAVVNSVLCVGCGTCVSTCPSGAIKGNHFTDEQVFAEIEGVLS